MDIVDSANNIHEDDDNKQIGKVGDFDYYLLQMSYAPEFCKTHPDKKDSKECSGTYNLVLHGLWPQYYNPIIVDGQKFYGPQNCPSKYDNITQDYINENVLAKIKNWDVIAPDFDNSNLAEHEFKKHGSATGITPFDYFALSIRLATSIPQYNIDENTTLEQIKMWYPNGKIKTDENGKFKAINFVFDKNISYYNDLW